MADFFSDNCEIQRDTNIAKETIDTNYLIQKLQSRFLTELNSSDSIGLFLQNLQKNFDSFALFGGVCRDWILNKKYKDIDIVVDSKYPSLFKTFVWQSIPYFDVNYVEVKYNSFGGMTICLDSDIFDIWDLRNTYAFKKKQFSPSWENLIKSVPFNIDSIIILNDGTVMENGLFQALESKTIDWLNKENLPDEKNIARRALEFQQKYNFALSDDLDKFCQDLLDKGLLSDTGKNKKMSSMKEGIIVTYPENDKDDEIPY